MDEYFETFGGVRDYLAGVVDEARRTGFTETILGRRRYLPDLTSDNRQRREMAERMALNAPIQGSAADIIKVAMLDVDARARARPGWRSRMLLQVHDELVLRGGAGGARAARGAGPRADGRRRRADRAARRLGRHRRAAGTRPRTDSAGLSGARRPRRALHVPRATTQRAARAAPANSAASTRSTSSDQAQHRVGERRRRRPGPPARSRSA